MPIHGQTPHFILLPFMAQGHMIPMVDIASLLSSRGARVTLLTTPHNADRFRTVIDRAINSGLNINVICLDFPVTEAGLPKGCENFDMLPSVYDATKFFEACDMLEGQVNDLLRHLNPSPTGLIADMCFPWTTDLAMKLNIPRMIFHGTSCFSLLLFHMMASSKCLEAPGSDFEYFVVPGLPDRIELTRAQVRGSGDHKHPDWSKLWGQQREAEKEAFGVVTNTFQELESEYIQGYRRVKGKKVWCIGPVSSCNTKDEDRAERGSRSVIGELECLKWLDLHAPGSVLYVCLGSLTRLATSQLIELAVALELSGRPFVWVVKNAPDGFGKWLLDEGYEERNGGRGLLIHGWAPQVLILSHQSVGGFLTHCGWNSTLEGIAAGVPMVTWPVSGEQFANEKLVVNVTKTGVRVGVEAPVFFGREESVGVRVAQGEIERAIEMLMGRGDEVEARRLRAKKLGEMASKAVSEGGSSYNNLTLLIEDVMNYEPKSSESS